MADLDMLVDMGFDREKSEMALKETGNLQGAVDWLDKNTDKTAEQIKEEQAASSSAAAAQAEEEAKSLKCDDCGKVFRNVAQAEFHASKSGHENFSESTEELKPLTEEEKAAKLEQLKAKLAQKRALQADEDKEARKKNEQIRMKNTRESQDAKEELQKKERLKEAQAKKREKEAEAEAKRRVLAKLEADKQERKRKAEAEKAKRAGQAPPPVVETKGPTSSGPTTSKPASAYTETRLALQTAGGRIMKSFPVETTLFEVAHALEEQGTQVSSFSTTFPKKTFDRTDFGMSLKEAGMVPSAALIVK